MRDRTHQGKRNRRSFCLGAIAACLAVGGISGCSQTSQHEYGKAGHQAGNAFDRDLNESKKWAKEASGRAHFAAERFASRAEVDADNDQNSMSVKSALMTSKGMNTSRLRVDADGKQVTLSGSVPSSEQRARASSIAKSVLGDGYTVINQLTISNF